MPRATKDNENLLENPGSPGAGTASGREMWQRGLQKIISSADILTLTSKLSEKDMKSMGYKPDSLSSGTGFDFSHPSVKLGHAAFGNRVRGESALLSADLTGETEKFGRKDKATKSRKLEPLSEVLLSRDTESEEKEA